MTSKRGFSVVAPISVTRPSSTAGSSASCWALLKRWISSRKKIVAAAAVARALDHRAHLGAPGLDRAVLLEARRPTRRRSRARASSCPSRAARAGSSSAAARSRSRGAAARPAPSSARWPTISSSVRGRIRTASGARRRCAGSSKRRSLACEAIVIACALDRYGRRATDATI